MVHRICWIYFIKLQPHLFMQALVKKKKNYRITDFLFSSIIRSTLILFKNNRSLHRHWKRGKKMCFPEFRWPESVSFLSSFNVKTLICHHCDAQHLPPSWANLTFLSVVCNAKLNTATHFFGPSKRIRCCFGGKIWRHCLHHRVYMGWESLQAGILRN